MFVELRHVDSLRDVNVGEHRDGIRTRVDFRRKG